VNGVCCQIEVSSSGRFLVQGSLTVCVCVCVCFTKCGLVQQVHSASTMSRQKRLD